MRTASSAKWMARLVNATLIALATASSLLLCELGSRLILKPVDFLSPLLVHDAILGVTVPAGSGGHDQWGFRNERVPESADVVALGDSHTYGNTAKMDESWPSVVARLTGRRVYNFGLGGYGPNQYYHLLQTKALALQPRTVVLGLYMGDDFDNAYRITYGLDHWSFLRRQGVGPANPDIWPEAKTQPQVSWHKRVRQWLSRHSILYRLVFHGILQPLKGRVQIEHAAQLYESTTSLLLPEKGVEEAFVPRAVLQGLDQTSPTVREGMRLTFQILKDMNALCAAHHIELIVAVIPTKELVFSRYLEHNAGVNLHEIIDAVIANERLARRELFRNLDGAQIRYIDLLPALERASQSDRIYVHSAVDTHPNKNGYRTIAETLSLSLLTPPGTASIGSSIPVPK